MQKIKSISLKKQCAGQKHSVLFFVESGNILDWFNQAIGKIGSGLQYSLLINTKVTQYCDANMNVISDMLLDKEGRFSKTTTNF